MNVTLMRPETKVISRTVVSDRPWPEAFAGAIASMMLAFTPFQAHLMPSDPLMWVGIGGGALVGAAVSWWLNSRPVRYVATEREAGQHRAAA